VIILLSVMKHVESGGLGRLGGRGRAAVAALLLIGAVGMGCGSSKAPPTPECVLNSDCLKFQPPGLVCALGFCVKPCNISSDCPNNERCVIVGGAVDGGADSGAGGAGAGTDGSVAAKDAGTAVASVLGTACQAPETVLCHYTSDCKAPLVCGADQECRNQCQSDVDCAGYNNQSDPQVCTVITHLCADPMVDKDYDPATMDFRTLDASTSGGGGAGGNGGGTGGHGGSTASCAAGLAGFHPSNLPASMAIPAGLPTITQSADATFDTDLLTFDPAIGPDGGAPVTMKVTLSDGRQAAALFFQSYTLSTGVTLTVTGEPPLIIVVNGTMNIQGTINTSQSSSDQWYGGGAPGPATPGRSGQCGLNSCSGGGQPGSTTRALEMGSGGGAFCGLGGAGSTLGPDAGAPAAGGTAYGVPELVPLVGGASGGSGISAVNQMNHGGGAIELVAGTSLTIDSNAIIDMGGGGDSEAYGIGGGSGGGILLESPTVNLKGALVAAGAGGSSYEAPGQNGGPMLTGAAGGEMLGGIGSSATSINGGAGTVSATDFGGGGGGAGRIRINTGCGGALNINSSALLTPGSTTPCYSTGTLN
jgi:hypothetical protein